MRRPLLWLQFASRRCSATILCSPNFGYRHYLKVLGDRTLDGLDLCRVRLIFNGAEPICVALCDEFLDALAPASCRATPCSRCTGWPRPRWRSAFPRSGAPITPSHFDRHRSTSGRAGRAGRRTTTRRR